VKAGITDVEMLSYIQNRLRNKATDSEELEAVNNVTVILAEYVLWQAENVSKTNDRKREKSLPQQQQCYDSSIDDFSGDGFRSKDGTYLAFSKMVDKFAIGLALTITGSDKKLATSILYGLQNGALDVLRRIAKQTKNGTFFNGCFVKKVKKGVSHTPPFSPLDDGTRRLFAGESRIYTVSNYSKTTSMVTIDLPKEFLPDWLKRCEMRYTVEYIGHLQDSVNPIDILNEDQRGVLNKDIAANKGSELIDVDDDDDDFNPFR